MNAISQPPDAADSSDATRSVIERAKQQLEQMIDLNPESLLLIDLQGRAVRTNRALLTLLGLTSYGQVLGHPLAEIFPVDSSQFFPDLIAGKLQASEAEASVRVARGGRRLMRFSVVGGGQGSETQVVIAHDATQEKQDSDLVEKACKVEAVRALMGALMHHLNQPLTVVMIRARLMSQALEQGRMNTDDLKATFQEITANAMQIANLLKRADESNDYVTQEYVDGLDILKIDE